MKKIAVLIIIAVTGLVSVGSVPSFAKEPKNVRFLGVRGGRKGKLGKIVPRLAAPVIKPMFRPVAAAPARPYVGPELGLAAGLFANIPSVAGEVRFHKFLGIDGTAVKAGLRYAQGKDANGTDRKSALVFADGIINLNGGPGAIFYLGGGLNYLAYTTGQTNGTAGGEVYLGVQEGACYGEAGYGAIRTGFSPSYKGLDLNMGFKWAY
jgi:hypothetical protein